MNGMSTQLDDTVTVTFGQADAVAAEKERVVLQRKPVYDFINRAFDILVALLCLTVGLPIYVITAAAIIINNPGNPFFVQKRVGRGGKVFKMIKFRTMYRDAEKMKPTLMNENEYECVHFKMKNDPRITSICKFLRKTSLDEISQEVNLLTGTTSVIGVRDI